MLKSLDKLFALISSLSIKKIFSAPREAKPKEIPLLTPPAPKTKIDLGDFYQNKNYNFSKILYSLSFQL